MAMSSLTYILGFSVRFFQPVYSVLGILWDHPRTIPVKFPLIWFSGFRGEDLNVIVYQNMPNFYNWHKSVERKISQKSPLNQITPNLAGMVLGWLPFKIVFNSPALHSRWLLLLKIEFFSIVHCCFSISQNELRLSDTILKGTHPRTIPARFGLIWFSGFRGEDLNVIFYQNMPNLHNRHKLAESIIAVPFKNVSNSPALHSRWLLLLKIEISSIVHCCFTINQNELKF
jgi:hypothetical protein